MSAVRIYTNESVHVAVAEGLKQRGVDAWSARDAGNRGLSDDAQLEYAQRERAVIFTHDEDFFRVVQAWTRSGKEHWGVIYVHQQRLGIGEMIRLLLEYALILESRDMKNRVEFL